MKLLLIPLSGGVGLGPLTRSMSIAKEARERGHETLFHCKKSFAQIAQSFDYDVSLAPEPNRPQIDRNVTPYRLSDVAIKLGWVEKDYLVSAIESEREVMQEFRPDVIFTETQFSVPISAPLENIPWAAATTWADHPDFRSPLYDKSQTINGVESNVNQILRKYDQSPINDVNELAFLRAQLKIAPTTPELQPELKCVPSVQYIGYLLSSEMESSFLPLKNEEKKFRNTLKRWNPDHTTVYVYLSPGDIPPEKWIKVLIESFKNTEVNVIVTLAPLEITPTDLPEVSNIAFFRSIPPAKAVTASDIVVTHGGANTLALSLLEGCHRTISTPKSRVNAEVDEFSDPAR